MLRVSSFGTFRNDFALALESCVEFFTEVRGVLHVAVDERGDVLDANELLERLYGRSRAVNSMYS